VHESNTSGAITTTLCEDVYSVVNFLIEAIDEYLVAGNILGTEVGNTVLLEAVNLIIRNLGLKQIHFREKFLKEMESCCAAANDFYRMMEHAEDVMVSLHRRYNRLEWTEEDPRVATINQEVDNLLHIYSNDAVYAVQRAHLFVCSTIQQSTIPKNLFSLDWENKFTHSEVAMSLVKTMEDFLEDFHSFLSNDFLYQKIVAALVQSVVGFYVRQLVQKADNLRRQARQGYAPTGFSTDVDEVPFGNVARAHSRMMHDKETFQKYFHQLVCDTPSLSKTVEESLGILEVIHECLGIAIGDADVSSMERFIVVVHKRTGSIIEVTMCLLSDLWMLVTDADKERLYLELLTKMEQELELISAEVRVLPSPSASCPLKGLRLDHMLKEFYMERIVQESDLLCGGIIHKVKGKIPSPQDITRSMQQKFAFVQTLRAEKSNRPNVVAFPKLPKFDFR
jgi:hypothetical protein